MKEKKYKINFKRLALVAVIVVLGVLFLQSCIIACGRGSRSGSAQGEPTDPPPVVREIILDKPPAGSPTPAPTEETDQAVRTLRVYDHKADAVLVMDLEDYIIGVVAGEMPASFAPEALKAQAVASRTYSLYGVLHGGCGTREDADICTNSQCCQAYTSAQALRDKLGSKFEEIYACFARAVRETEGEVLLYKGRVIEALYHASAGGKTEDSENAFANSRPYLRSVESANEVGSRQEGEARFSHKDFIAKANAAYPKAKLVAEDLVGQVRVLAWYESDRVKTLQLGETTITGKQARKLFDLLSTQFTVTFTSNRVIFATKGYGHGVGLSQSGANGMAQSGSDYREILLHYYTGVTIEKLTQ
ncbi:MAG: stage II sporulation protein D [Clostridiales bacterium]|nr:stage II sporulation protein D [Clostridiales bacterium]